MSSIICRAQFFSRVTATITAAILAGILAGCEKSKDTTPIDQSKMEATDLVADVMHYASRGSNGPYITWGKQGDTFISTNGDDYIEKVKVTERRPCVFTVDRSMKFNEADKLRSTQYTINFAKVKKALNLAATYRTGTPLAELILEGEPGFICFNDEATCTRTKMSARPENKEYVDRATNSFRELVRRFCPAASAAQITETAPPPPKWDGTKSPTTSDIQEYWDTKGKGAKVTSSSCVSAGTEEWRCEVTYVVFINNPKQLMLAGYYENTYSAVYGLRGGNIQVIRDYYLINQRRI